MKRGSLADAERFPVRQPPSAAEGHLVRDHRGGTAPAAAPHHSGVIPLWPWVTAGFLFLALLWAAMFVVARSARIESVPLTTREAQP